MKFKFAFPLFLFAVFFLVSVSSPPIVFGQMQDSFVVKKQVLYPGFFYYPVKRLFEKITESLKFSSDSKIRYERDLLETRLSEIDFVVTNYKLGEIQKSSERFAYQAGVLTDLVNKENKSELTEDLKKDFKKYENYLAIMRDKFHSNSSYWMLMQHDINSLKFYSEKLNND